MFAALYSSTASASALLAIAQDFTPRFERIGPLVLLDLSGLSRLFGSAREIGDQLRQRAIGVPMRIAIAPTSTAAILLALERPGLTVVTDEIAAAVAPLPVNVIGRFIDLRLGSAGSGRSTPGESGGARQDTCVSPPPDRRVLPPNVAEMDDVLPYFESCLDRATPTVATAHRACGAGWSHPRESHAANAVRRARRGADNADKAAADNADKTATDTSNTTTPNSSAPSAANPAASSAATVRQRDTAARLETLRRWGVKTLGALAALPPGDVYERLGGAGVRWQRLARGEATHPLQPWVAEDPFEGSLELEWPIDGLEPLSFVLGRLLDPLAERLERADRGAAVLHTHLVLTTREVHARTVQLPAPMRDPKTLRTLMLLDLESNPPSAAIDVVRVLIEPTPARVLQWTLYERAQASPEHVSTLIARLTALMGEGHVGSPRVVDTWRPGAFEMIEFGQAVQADQVSEPSTTGPPSTAFRRFRLPIPARVQMQDGRPQRVMVDRRGMSGGVVQQSAGPWRTSGAWWTDGQPPDSPSQSWNRDEWDVLLADGTLYRVVVERDVGAWFIEGTVD